MLPALMIVYARQPRSDLKTGVPAAHRRVLLMLLDSSPDMVRGRQSHKTRFSTASPERGRTDKNLCRHINPRCSGLRVTGHR